MPQYTAKAPATPSWRVEEGDARDVLPELDEASVNCCVTSPPYWGLRDYGHPAQLGLEKTPEQYTESLIAVFREVRRVLRDDGTVWLVLGDSYARSGTAPPRPDHSGSTLHSSRALAKQGYARAAAAKAHRQTVPQGLKPKDLVGIPWRVAFALQADGWYLRSDVIWAKPNPMPENVLDRPTRCHEYVFLLAKSRRYYFDRTAVRETGSGLPWNSAATFHAEHQARRQSVGTAQTGGTGHRRDLEQVGRNIRSVWTIATQPFQDAHFAVFPSPLVVPCIEAGCPTAGTVLDPFCGAGTTGIVALRMGRSFIGIELNPKYAEMSRRRIEQDAPLLNAMSAAKAETKDR